MAGGGDAHRRHRTQTNAQQGRPEALREAGDLRRERGKQAARREVEGRGERRRGDQDGGASLRYHGDVIAALDEVSGVRWRKEDAL